MLSQRFQPAHPTSERLRHTQTSRFTTAASLRFLERRQKYTQSEQINCRVSSQAGGGEMERYASSAELCGEDRTSDGRPANSGRVPSRPPPPHPSPPTEALSAEVGGIHKGVEQGCRELFQFSFNQLYCTHFYTLTTRLFTCTSPWTWIPDPGPCISDPG